MAYEIQIRETARKQIRALERDIQRRVLAKIATLAATPRQSGTVKLAGHPNLYRIRVGRYRILYEIHDSAILVVVILVAHRRESFRNL